ncbi:MAG: epoxyqueuosine reductase [Candidatus Helarchaeota archaeon]|nr:epoxyqueuosine reductase [Candidatus Helarchaeota archaeon]
MLEQGAIKVGFATNESLAGGPPSADITYIFEDAQSAVCLAVPLDRDKIRAFFRKDLPNGRIEHETDNIEAYLKAYQISYLIVQFLREKGYKAEVLIPNFKYRRDVPGWRLRSIPPVSLRYLAVRSGVGSYGWSGNIGTKGYGTAIILGGLVTSATLEPTDPVSPDESFCNQCKLCVQVCPMRMFSGNEEESVKLGGYKFNFSKRRNLMRCFISCGGFSGLDKTEKWSTWSLGRHPYPETDEEVIETLADSFQFSNEVKIAGEKEGFNYKEHIKDPEFQEPLKGKGIKRTIKMIKNTTLTCGNCQLVCWGDPEETRINYGILTKSGCVVKDANGNLIVLPPEEAAKHHAMQKKPNIFKRIGRGILRRIAKWYLNRHYEYLTGDRS